MTEFVCVACDQLCAWEDRELEGMGILRHNGVIRDCLCPFAGVKTDFGVMDEMDVIE